MLVGSKVVPEQVLLRADAHHLLDQRRVVVDRVPEHEGLAEGRVHQPSQHADQSGLRTTRHGESAQLNTTRSKRANLAGTVVTQQHKDLVPARTPH